MHSFGIYLALLAIGAQNVAAFAPAGGRAFALRPRVSMSATITSAMVKELRDKCGAGMMDCKKALAENNGDVDAAVDFLRKKGLAAVAKKADRIASSGLVCVSASADGKAAAVLEVNSETDFVAKNEMFQGMVSSSASIAAEGQGQMDSLLAASYTGPESDTVQDELTRMVATIGENMSFRRVERLAVNDGVVATYMHNPTKGNMGRIGCAVALESSGDKGKLAEVGKQIAMHIAAQSPVALTIEDVPQEMVDREKQVLVDQAAESGKPAAAIEKMVEGRLRKFYEEIVLMEQPFVMDGKVKIKDLLKSTGKEIGADVIIKSYTRMELGDGLEKRDWTQ